MLDGRRTSVSGAVWPDLATLIEVGAIRHLHGDMAHAICRRRTLAIPGAKSSRNHTVSGEIGPDVLEDLPRDRIPIAAGRLFAPVPFDDPRKPLRGRSQRPRNRPCSRPCSRNGVSNPILPTVSRLSHRHGPR